MRMWLEEKEREQQIENNNAILNEIEEFTPGFKDEIFKVAIEDVQIGDLSFADEPEGEEQYSGEWVDQWQTGEDDFYGHIYLYLRDMDKWLKIEFSM